MRMAWEGREILRSNQGHDIRVGDIDWSKFQVLRDGDAQLRTVRPDLLVLPISIFVVLTSGGKAYLRSSSQRP